jgi:glutathione synthase/RimK-type ligase-like ATP-grasp enzyme
VTTQTSGPDVLLATCSWMPEGEEYTGTTHLSEAFEARGVDARWVTWDDPTVDWSAALVAVRATWDYETRREEFLAWARAVPWMLNSADVFAWNTDKAYLPQLAARGLPVVPTLIVDQRDDLLAVVAEVSTAGTHPVDVVVKPTVGAGGRGAVVISHTADPVELDGSGLGHGPWAVQPMVESVRTEGETSVFVLDGQVVSQARKVPATGEFRVHEQYGGSTVAVPLTDEAVALAHQAVDLASSLLGATLDYARVDQMRLPDGALALSELEVTEPGLYLDVLPGNAALFADLAVARLRER